MYHCEFSGGVLRGSGRVSRDASSLFVVVGSVDTFCGAGVCVDRRQDLVRGAVVTGTVELAY